MNRIYLTNCPYCKQIQSLGNEPADGKQIHCEMASCGKVFQCFVIGEQTVMAPMESSRVEVTAAIDAAGSNLTEKNRGRPMTEEDAIAMCGCPECTALKIKRFLARQSGGDGKTLADCKLRFDEGRNFGGFPAGASPEGPVRIFRDRESDYGPRVPSSPTESAAGASSGVPTVPELMADAATTFRARNVLYGDSYKSFHTIARALFPGGLQIETEDEWMRFGVLFFAIGKMVRYCNNFKDGGHVDSAHDLGVYSFMLEEVTRMGQQENK